MTIAEIQKTSSNPKTTSEASFFKLKTRLLKQGRTDTTISETDHLQLRLKVYASGGENGLHAHAAEDHSFLILQGTARFYDKDGAPKDVGRYEGVTIPAGVHYRFEATSSEELILFRVGAKTQTPAGPPRVNVSGGDMAPNHADNRRVETIFKDAYFE